MASSTGTILLIGASRGLGLGLAEEYLARGWHVIATARDPAHAPGLAKLAGAHPDHLRLEATDVTAPDAGAKLAASLAGTTLNVIFVVAGQSKAGRTPAFQASPDIVAQEFLTNSFAPPVVAEALLGHLAPGGTVVFMTSVLGSLANAAGMAEIYSASKAALNMLGIGFATRHPDLRTILMHPGWVKTDMGGDSAPLDVPTSARGMADVIAHEAGKTGVAYLDYAGKTIAW